MNDPRIINSPDQVPNWDAYDAGVVKIVVGELDEDKHLALKSLPTDFASRFPKLTHLYLWGISDLTALPPLPPGLRCLDVRNCPDLKVLPELPHDELGVLVLERCPALSTLGNPTAGFPALDDLSLKGCTGLPASTMDALLAGSPRLTRLDLSDCLQFTRASNWPPELVDLRLDGCTSLETIPKHWPRKLGRVSLRGATALVRLPDFRPALDCVDLAFTESLLELPKERGTPRTLILHGSGILMPPASEHGSTPEENVAARTAAYFEEVELTGKGEVQRCKVLILGNGGAGKTCLSLVLVPGQDPAQAEILGSTHGVQFWDWDFPTTAGGFRDHVHLHLWDFGGQEIYHNTHRLFMGKGAVFVVVWKPEQDGAVPPVSGGYQDEWRPLRYWLDLIHQACPHKPRIAVVCSHHEAPSAELEEQWKRQAGPHAGTPCYFVDSRFRRGQFGELTAWLEREVGRVVETQGTAVPTYWEIAQNLVEGWVKRMAGDVDFARQHNQMHPERFREALETAIRQAIEQDREGRYERLQEAIDHRGFALTDDRLRRTLEFLTHSGWIYWDRRLHDERVIVGQKWALDGVYAVLDRRPNAVIYRFLNESDGRFTRAQLAEMAWNAAGYTPTEQELLLSFLLRCGLCFQLRPGADSWREEDVYVSFEHLPTSKEVRLQRVFDERYPNLSFERKAISVPGLHKHHWQNFLTRAGTQYGKDARYALDGLYLENEEGEKLLILCHLEKTGLGGEIEIHIGGGKIGERLRAAEGLIREFLPGAGENPPADLSAALGKAAEKEEVFISYAWDPPTREGESGIPPGYEIPVDAIERFLSDKPVKLIRDKRSTGFGDNLRDFMLYGSTRPHVIVVHSDKYWMSPYCIFELWHLRDECKKKGDRGMLSVMIPVEHVGSGITTEKGLKRFLEFWKECDDSPAMIEWSAEELKDHARSLLRELSRDLAQHLSVNVRWSDGEQAVWAHLAERLTQPASSTDV